MQSNNPFRRDNSQTPESRGPVEPVFLASRMEGTSSDPAPQDPQQNISPPPYQNESAADFTTERGGYQGDTKEIEVEARNQYAVPPPTVPTSSSISPQSAVPIVTTSRESPTYATPSTSTSPEQLPPSFSRLPPHDLAYGPFQPMFLVASGRYLNKGFPSVPPPSNLRPHPFIIHDVNEGDWTRFLDDIRNAATLTDRQLSIAQGLPIVSIVPVINSLVAHGIKTYMKKKKSETAGEAVDKWNHHFFRPRKLEAILMKGQTKMSGQNDRSISNLHTPETVSLPRSSVSAASSSEKGDTQSEDSKGKGKSKETGEKNDDKIYRLFVVSMLN